MSDLLILTFIIVQIIDINPDWIKVSGWMQTAPGNKFILPATIVLFVLLAGFFTGRNKIDHQAGRNPTAVDDEAKGLALEIQQRLNTGSVYSELQHTVTMMSLLSVPSLLQRTYETYDLGQSNVRQHVILEGLVSELYVSELDFNAGKDRGIFFPVVIATKEHLTSNFRAWATDGTPLSVVSFTQYVHLIGEVLRMLLRAAYQLQDNTPLPGRALDVELAVLTILARRDQEARDIEIVANSISSLLPGPLTIPLREIARILREYATRHALLVKLAISHDRQFHVEFEQNLKYEPDRSAGGRLAALLGIYPVRLFVEPLNATRCESYHLQVRGPDGMYISRQTLDGATNAMEYHHHFQKQTGQGDTHFYTRDFRIPQDNSKPEVIVKYKEKPPGSTFRAAIASSASFVLILILGLISSHKVTALSTDAAALLLTFPAIAAAWLGYETPTGKLLEGTLWSRLSLGLTTLVSLGASAAAIAYKEFPNEINRTNYTWPAFPFHMQPFGIDDLWWASLALLAFTNAFIMCYGWIIRVREYNRFLRSDTKTLSNHVARP